MSGRDNKPVPVRRVVSFEGPSGGIPSLPPPPLKLRTFSDSDFGAEVLQDFIKSAEWPSSPHTVRKEGPSSVKSDDSPGSGRSSRNSLEEVFQHFNKSKQWPPSPVISPLSKKGDAATAEKTNDALALAKGVVVKTEDEDDDFLIDLINLHMSPGPPPPPPPSPEKAKRPPLPGEQDTIRTLDFQSKIINTSVVHSQSPSKQNNDGLIYFETELNSNDLVDSGAHAVEKTVNASVRTAYKQQSQLIEVNQKKIAVFKYRGSIHAFDAVCPHQGGPLHIGDIEEVAGETCVSCPWHNWSFALASGRKRPKEHSHVSLDVYKVQAKGDGKILIGFESFDPSSFFSAEF